MHGVQGSNADQKFVREASSLWSAAASPHLMLRSAVAALAADVEAATLSAESLLLLRSLFNLVQQNIDGI